MAGIMIHSYWISDLFIGELWKESHRGHPSIQDEWVHLGSWLCRSPLNTGILLTGIIDRKEVALCHSRLPLWAYPFHSEYDSLVVSSNLFHNIVIWLLDRKEIRSWIFFPLIACYSEKKKSALLGVLIIPSELFKCYVPFVSLTLFLRWQEMNEI